MKIRKMTIVWFVLAALMAASFFVTADEDASVLTWADAVFIKDGKVLPENAGKLVAVSGTPAMVEPAADEQLGIAFTSPRIHRFSYVLKYHPHLKTWDYEYASSDDAITSTPLTGQMYIGEYELDPELINELDVYTNKDMGKEEFTEESLAHLQDIGSLLKWGGRYCFSEIEDKYDASFAWDKMESLDELDYVFHPEWDNTHMIYWSQWVLRPDDKITVAGIQKGNTLQYCEDLSGSVSKKRIVTADEVADGEPANPILTKIIGLLFAALFVFLGVRSMRKKKKEY